MPLKSLGIALATLLLIIFVVLYIVVRTRQSPLDGNGQSDNPHVIEKPVEHAVILHLMYDQTKDGYPEDDGLVNRMHALQDRLINAIEAAGVGELDGDEFGQGECVIYMYGPNADALWMAIEAVVMSAEFGDGSFVYKRYGDVNDEDAIEVKEPL